MSPVNFTGLAFSNVNDVVGTRFNGKSSISKYASSPSTQGLRFCELQLRTRAYAGACGGASAKGRRRGRAGGVRRVTAASSTITMGSGVAVQFDGGVGMETRMSAGQ